MVINDNRLSALLSTSGVYFACAAIGMNVAVATPSDASVCFTADNLIMVILNYKFGYEVKDTMASLSIYETQFRGYTLNRMRFLFHGVGGVE